MSKSNIHLHIDTLLLERAKLNNINISKEVEEHLERLLSVPTYDSPLAEPELLNSIKELEALTTENLKKLNDLKLQQQKQKKEQENRNREQLKWHKL
jgi:hypothetical protein